MDLYLKIDFPSGRKIRLWKSKARAEFEKSTLDLVFYPERPTTVPDEIGKRLLEQDPHLLDTNPHPNYNNVPEDDTLSGDELKALLEELAGIEDFGKLKAQQLREYAAKLGLSFPVGTKKTEWVKMLEDKCAELAEALAE